MLDLGKQTMESPVTAMDDNESGLMHKIQQAESGSIENNDAASYKAHW